MLTKFANRRRPELKPLSFSPNSPTAIFKEISRLPTAAAAAAAPMPQ